MFNWFLKYAGLQIYNDEHFDYFGNGVIHLLLKQF